MDELVLDAFGKINLALDVLYKRDDGYHEINTIMQQIGLKDTVILKIGLRVFVFSVMTIEFLLMKGI